MRPERLRLRATTALLLFLVFEGMPAAARESADQSGDRAVSRLLPARTLPTTAPLGLPPRPPSLDAAAAPASPVAQSLRALTRGIWSAIPGTPRAKIIREIKSFQIELDDHRGEEVLLPSPVARAFLAAPRRETAPILGLIPPGSKALASGAEGFVLLTPESDVVRVSRIQQRPAIPEVLQAKEKHVSGSWQIERLPLVRTDGVTYGDAEAMSSRLKARGYAFAAGEGEPRNIGRLASGGLVVIDPGAAVTREQAVAARRAHVLEVAAFMRERGYSREEIDAYVSGEAAKAGADPGAFRH